MLRRMSLSSPPHVCFVVPTYNEAANITPLLERVTGLYPGGDTAVLVVDDRSPDGTGDLVRAFAAGDRRVHLLEGPRCGLGRAYVRGIRHALDELGAEVIVQMDADFSHDPADARRLLDRLGAGADVVIGSRYVAGGGIDNRWSLRRRLLSGWGNQLTRWVAGLRRVRDCTAGFKAISANALARSRHRRHHGAGAGLPGRVAAPPDPRRRARRGGANLLPRARSRADQAGLAGHRGVSARHMAAATHRPSPVAPDVSDALSS